MTTNTPIQRDREFAAEFAKASGFSKDTQDKYLTGKNDNTVVMRTIVAVRLEMQENHAEVLQEYRTAVLSAEAEVSKLKDEFEQAVTHIWTIVKNLKLTIVTKVLTALRIAK